MAARSIVTNLGFSSHTPPRKAASDMATEVRRRQLKPQTSTFTFDDKMEVVKSHAQRSSVPCGCFHHLHVTASPLGVAMKTSPLPLYPRRTPRRRRPGSSRSRQRPTRGRCPAPIPSRFRRPTRSVGSVVQPTRGIPGPGYLVEVGVADTIAAAVLAVAPLVVRDVRCLRGRRPEVRPILPSLWGGPLSST